MASEIERLTVSLEANVKKFERELARARGVATKALGDVEREVETREKAIANAFGGIAKKAVAALAAGFSLNEIRKAADDYIKIMNTLKTAGISGSQLSSTFDQLYATAQRNAVPLDALASLYGRVSQAQTTLKASSTELLGLTEVVAQSLRVSGTSATEASGSLLQLAQALSGGKVQAEEYNSLLDGMYPLLQAAAAGLKEAGGDVAKLTGLVKDGKVSSEAFFRAIQAGAPLLEEKLAGAALTTEQALTRLNNEFIRAVGEFDRATGASQTLAAAINTLAGSIGGIGQSAAAAVNGVQALIAKVGELAKASAGVQRQQALAYQEERSARVSQGREMGLANAGGRDALAQDRAEANAKATEQNRRALADFRATEVEFANALKTTALPPNRPAGLGRGIKPVSLDDFKVPGEEKGSGGGGGGGGSDKDKATSLERYVINLQKAGELAKADLATAGLSNVEREKARALVEATAAAQKDFAAGLRETAELTTAEKDRILALAAATAQWKEEAKRVKDAMDFTSDLAKDAFKGLVSDLMAGKSAADALANALQKMASKLADKAIDGLFDSLFKAGTGGGSGLLGKIFGFADGGRVAGPGSGKSDSILARLSNGEFVVNARSARQYGPLLDAINSGKTPKFAGGGMVGGAPSMAGLRPPTIPSFGGGQRGNGNQRLAMTVDVRGATGNQEIQTMVRQGIAAGIQAYDRQLDRSLPGKLAVADARFG